MIDRHQPVTEEELHAYVDGEIAADRRGASTSTGSPAQHAPGVLSRPLR